ncbi:MAG: hypothetical protein ABW085_01345 [Sedimenticola sp.]
MRLISFAKALGVLTLLGAGSTVSAVTMDYTGTSQSIGNCIPFGCPDSYDPHMGFVYQDINPFTLNPGDVIAFDMGAVNDHELSFDLSLAATTTNGGYTVDSNGFTLVSSLGAGHFGDTIVGNFDLAFIVNTTFTFNGGGLIVDFLNTNGPVNDTTHSGSTLVASLDSPYTVRRYFNGTSVGDMSNSRLGDGQNLVGDLRIVTGEVPSPAPLALLGIGVLALGLTRRKKT